MSVKMNSAREWWWLDLWPVLTPESPGNFTVTPTYSLIIVCGLTKNHTGGNSLYSSLILKI